MASELITSASKLRGFLATPSYLRLWFAGGIGNAMRWLELLVAGIFTYEVTHSTVLGALGTVGRRFAHAVHRHDRRCGRRGAESQAIAADAAFRHGRELGGAVRARVLRADPGLAYCRWRHRRRHRVGGGARRASPHDR